jgi:uncharacterized DUF497 family protein
MDPDELLGSCTGFDWDQGHLLKNWERHAVSDSDCEQVFFNRPLASKQDLKHSSLEPRYFVLRRTDAARRLFVVFTIRDQSIQVISAREMNRRERREYDRHG